MKQVVVIGGGIAGMQCAIALKEMGHNPLVIEKSDRLGGKLNNWDRLFPDQTPSHQVLGRIVEKFHSLGIEHIMSVEATDIDNVKNEIKLSNNQTIKGDALVIASGYELFDARLKEEYGYGMYQNVVTSADLEVMFHENRVLCSDGRKPQTIALLHCVGSRDQQVGQNHCSRLCCVTGIKQAIELKELFPDAGVYNYYMDMRMFGPGYEELYRRSQQEFGVNHIRGRISEASQTIDNRIQIRAEDTLIGRPIRQTVDMLVLLVGMCAGKSNEHFSQQCGLELRPSNFMKPLNPFDQSNYTESRGVFLAGTVKAPKNVSESLHDAVSAARAVNEFLAKN